MATAAAAKSLLLYPTLRVSARGGLSRFLVESFVTPSLYPWIFRDSEWGNVVVNTLVNNNSNPRQVLETFERNVRFRTTARRRYLQEQFNIPPFAKARFIESDDAPTRAAVVAGAFPEIMRFRYLGDDEERRRQLLAVARQANTGKELANWNLEDVLESCGCAVFGTSAFNTFCETEGLYELFTDEYIEGLARHLEGRKLVLEVGAGSGRLSHLLRKRLKGKTEVIATDDGSWSRMRGHRPRYPVVKCDYQSALKNYDPDVIITSWMPMNQDWTLDFRRKSSCEEYVLIGSQDSCGRSWHTWGQRFTHNFDPSITALEKKPTPDRWPIDIFQWMSGSTGDLEPDFSSDDSSKAEQPPFTKDGFEKRELENLSRLQLSRFDRMVRSGNSKTVSFRRVA